MSSRLVFFPTAYLVWLILSWPPDVAHLLTGLGVAGLVTGLAGHLFVGRLTLLWQPHRWIHFFLVYLPRFLWEVVKANFDVAYRVVSPRMPIRPGIITVRTGLISDIGLTFLANSITLTPGTMTVDIDRERGLLYIHWIAVRTSDVEEATRLIAARFERQLRVIWEEEPER